MSTHFLQGVDVYVLCVCVYAHTHTLHVGYECTSGFHPGSPGVSSPHPTLHVGDVSLGVGMRHLESPEEIQMYCSDNIHVYRAV